MGGGGCIHHLQKQHDAGVENAPNSFPGAIHLRCFQCSSTGLYSQGWRDGLTTDISPAKLNTRFGGDRLYNCDWPVLHGLFVCNWGNWPCVVHLILAVSTRRKTLVNEQAALSSCQEVLDELNRYKFPQCRGSEVTVMPWLGRKSGGNRHSRGCELPSRTLLAIGKKSAWSLPRSRPPPPGWLCGLHLKGWSLRGWSKGQNVIRRICFRKQPTSLIASERQVGFSDFRFISFPATFWNCCNLKSSGTRSFQTPLSIPRLWRTRLRRYVRRIICVYNLDSTVANYQLPLLFFISSEAMTKTLADLLVFVRWSVKKFLSNY